MVFIGKGRTVRAISGASSGKLEVNTANDMPQNHKVQLTGDVFIEYKTINGIGDKGVVKLSLTNSESYWDGLASYVDEVEREDDGFGDETETITKEGILNLTLTNGAKWENKKINTSYEEGFEGSRISKFVGGQDEGTRGVVVQSDAKPITIGNYKGHALFVFNHEESTPTTIKGGSVTIKAAEDGSAITLRTSNAGITTTDQDQVANVLNSLAGKLTYEEFKTSAGHLVGKVEIADGLTASAQKIGNITFRKADGVGTYVKQETPEPPTPSAPSEFTAAITLDKANNKPYIDAGVWNGNDTTYTFTKDTTIKVNGDAAVKIGSKNGTNTAGENTLTLESTGGTMAKAVDAKSESALTISGKEIILKSINPQVLSSYGIWQHSAEEVGSVNFTGLTKITASGKTHVYGAYATKGMISFEGLEFNGTGSHVRALSASSNGIINVSGTKKVELHGDIFTNDIAKTNESDEIDKLRSRVNLTLMSNDSSWQGLASYAKFDDSDSDMDDRSTFGTLNLILQNGAKWENKKINHSYERGFEGSHITSFIGGTDENNRGVVVQSDEKPILIDTYSGHTLFVYAHNEANPTTMIGGDVKITNASAGSLITLRTANNGITIDNKEQVNNVLNALANKLFFTNYKTHKTNLTGKVEIAEGLTASSASKVVDMKFREATGQGYYEEEAPAPTPTIGAVKTPEVFPADRVVTINTGEKIGKKVMMSGAYNSTTTPEMIVDMNHHNLSIEIDGSKDNKYIAGIFADQNKTINFSNAAVDGKITVSVDHAQQQASGIELKSNSHFTSSANIEIEKVQTGSLRVYGIYGAGANIVSNIEGNLKIRNIVANGDTQHKNAKGLSFSSAGGTFTVAKDVDIELNGIGVENKMGKVVLSGGSVVTPTDLTKTQRAFVADTAISEGGEIYFNVNSTNKTLGTKVVSVKGDIETKASSNGQIKGRVYLGLKGSTSDWTGASVYYNNASKKPGEVHLFLQDKATWHNTRTSKVEYDMSSANWNGSVITDFKGSPMEGHEGYIFQEDEKPLTIEHYSGHTKLVYAHTGDGSESAHYTAGNTTIKQAVAGSSITVITNNTDIDMNNPDKVAATFNALAGKLFYDEYKTSVKHLKGKVSIADGLTASSNSVKLEDITFKDENGQGIYVKPAPTLPTGPVKTSETLTADRDILVSESNSAKRVSGLYPEEVADRNHPMTVNMNGYNLSINAASTKDISSAIYMVANKHVVISNPNEDKKITLEATNTDTKGANAIQMDTYSNLNISSAVDIKKVQTQGDSANGISMQGQDATLLINGPLSIANVDGVRGKGKGVNANGILVTGDNSSVTVEGIATINHVKGSALKTVGHNTSISVDGAIIQAETDANKEFAYNAVVVDKGTVNINVEKSTAETQPGTNIVKILGDVQISKQFGQRVAEYSGGKLVDWKSDGALNMALMDNASFWRGVAKYEKSRKDYGSGGFTESTVGDFNLWIQNG